MADGEEAPNPANEVVSFGTTVMNLRYGVSDRFNLSASLPYLNISSDKFQGAEYSRANNGFGDLVITGQYAVMTSPQLTLEAGLELPTGSVDETDDFGQRICDILSLGSGTVDPVLGMSIWVPKFGTQNLDMVASLRHRFSGGQNKWGYAFGDLTLLTAHWTYKMSTAGRFGVRFEGWHSEGDTWYDNTVPERGASILYVGPTLAWTFSPALTVGGFAKFPTLMQLEGAQMLSPVIFGFEFSSSLTDVFKGIRGQESE